MQYANTYSGPDNLDKLFECVNNYKSPREKIIIIKIIKVFKNKQ